MCRIIFSQVPRHSSANAIVISGAICLDDVNIAKSQSDVRKRKVTTLPHIDIRDHRKDLRNGAKLKIIIRK